MPTARARRPKANIASAPQAYEAIFAAQGFGRVTTSTDIARDAARLLSDATLANAAGEAAARGGEDVGTCLSRIARPLCSHPQTLCQPLLTSGAGPAYGLSHRMLTKVTDC